MSKTEAYRWSFPGGASGKEPTQPMQEIRVWFLGWDVPLEEEMATHSCILAWRITWTEEPKGLQSMGWQRDAIEVT